MRALVLVGLFVLLAVAQAKRLPNVGARVSVRDTRVERSTADTDSDGAIDIVKQEMQVQMQAKDQIKLKNRQKMLGIKQKMHGKIPKTGLKINMKKVKKGHKMRGTKQKMHGKIPKTGLKINMKKVKKGHKMRGTKQKMHGKIPKTGLKINMKKVKKGHKMRGIKQKMHGTIPKTGLKINMKKVKKSQRINGTEQKKRLRTFGRVFGHEYLYL